MPAIKPHKTPVNKIATWDGSKALVEAQNDQTVLLYMHAWVNESGDPSKKSSYLFPHHEPGIDTPANIAAVNNALVRLMQSNLPVEERLQVEAHLRQHRIDADLGHGMSGIEIADALKRIKDLDDLKATEVKVFNDTMTLQEKSNMAEWLESRLHLTLTQIADDMFGAGRLTRDERKVLSGAIGGALDSYHNLVKENAPQLFQRSPWDDAPEDEGQTIAEADMGKAHDKRADVKTARQWLTKAIKLHQDHMDGKAPTTGAEGEKSQQTMMDQMMRALKALGDEIDEAARLDIDGEFIPLIEKALRADGTVPIKVIQPGWGSSGFYSREVLKRDGAKAFPKGTKMLWNHPTAVEEAERPEGDLNDLASELVSDARWMDNGPKGPGLYADAKVFEAFQPAVNDLAPHIGVSIHARGKGMYGEADGQQGVLVQEIMASPFNRVDYVTMPGAGGEIISLFEAARTVRTDKKTKAGTVPAEEEATDVAIHESNLEEDMADEKLIERVATLETTNQTLATSNARLAEALALRDAKDMVKEALAATTLPEVTKSRLVESLAKNPPMKDGGLDREAFATSIKEAVKAEIQYLEKLTGKGQIRGLGESANDDDEGEDDTTNVEESLQESFTALGLSETGAKIAAKGRG